MVGNHQSPTDGCWVGALHPSAGGGGVRHSGEYQLWGGTETDEDAVAGATAAMESWGGLHARPQQQPWAGGQDFVPSHTAANTNNNNTSEPSYHLWQEAGDVDAAPLSMQPPHGWSQHVSPDGTLYYFNSFTGVSQWERPRELS